MQQSSLSQWYSAHYGFYLVIHVYSREKRFCDCYVRRVYNKVLSPQQQLNKLNRLLKRAHPNILPKVRTLYCIKTIPDAVNYTAAYINNVDLLKAHSHQAGADVANLKRKYC